MGQARKGCGDLDAVGCTEDGDKHLFDEGEEVLRRDETHFDVGLGEFRLAVGPQVLIAETAGDLEIFFHASGHKELFVLLRRLREGVETSRVQPARHEEVAGAFRGAFAEDGGFDFPETVGVEDVAHGFDHSVAESEIGGHDGTAEVEVAMGQAQVLVGDLLIEREGEDIGLVEDFQIVGHDFYFAGREFGIFRAFEAFSHGAGDLDDVLVAQSVGGLGCCGVFFWTEDNLGDAFAVSQIDEDDPAVVAAGTDPAGEGGALTDIFGAQGAAMRTTEIHGAGV